MHTQRYRKLYNEVVSSFCSSLRWTAMGSVFMWLVKHKTSLGPLFQFYNQSQLYKGLKRLLWETWFTDHINSIGQRKTFHVLACLYVTIFVWPGGCDGAIQSFVHSWFSFTARIKDLTIKSMKIDNGDLIKHLFEYRSYDSQPVKPYWLSIR